jgi:hypothetical protein
MSDELTRDEMIEKLRSNEETVMKCVAIVIIATCIVLVLWVIL